MILRNAVAYGLAIEHARYRAATRIAIAELRRGPDDPLLWQARLAGAFARRNRTTIERKGTAREDTDAGQGDPRGAQDRPVGGRRLRPRAHARSETVRAGSGTLIPRRVGGRPW